MSKRRPITTAFELRVAQRGLTVYRVAEPGWRWVWNRYGTRTIGAGVVTGRWCWSLTWRRA